MQRNLKYAILGLLCGKQATGYEIAQEFESAIGEFWQAKHSQIYPELKRLTEEGNVTFSVEMSNNMLKKKVYSITDKGREDFMQWLETPEPMEHTPKSVFRLRVFFSNYLEPGKRLSLIESRLREHELRRDYLIKNLSKFNCYQPDKDSPEFADYLTLMGSIMREEANISWLTRCRQLLMD